MHLLPIALTVKNFNKSTAATIQLGSYNMPPRIWGGGGCWGKKKATKTLHLVTFEKSHLMVTSFLRFYPFNAEIRWSDGIANLQNGNFTKLGGFHIFLYF